MAGTLSAGTGVTFRSVDIYFPSTSDWSGIRVDSGGSADLSGATIRDGARQSFTLRANADEDDETVSLGLGTLPEGVSAGTPASATVTLRDIDVNEPPQIKGPTTVSFAENGTDSVATYRATDPEGAAITWAWAGPDGGAFTMRGDSLYFAQVPDYENPMDANQDTVYNVTVTASDGDPDGNEPGARWQWQRRADATAAWEPVSSSSSARSPPSPSYPVSSGYTPGAADGGQQLRATVDYSDGHGDNKQAQSGATDPVQEEVSTVTIVGPDSVWFAENGTATGGPRWRIRCRI